MSGGRTGSHSGAGIVALVCLSLTRRIPQQIVFEQFNSHKKNDGFCNLTKAKPTYSHVQNKCKITYQLFFNERRDTLNAANFAQVYKKIANA